jgi:predicted aspartyl protease
MVTLRTTILVENVERRGAARAIEHVLVDNASELTWIPRAILESLGVRVERFQGFLLADGRTVYRRLGIALVHAGGSNAPDFVVFAEPGDTVVLGSRSLEGLNLRVDPFRRELVSAGAIFAAA